jgi:predicted phage terminase large subunit-like protein
MAKRPNTATDATNEQHDEARRHIPQFNSTNLSTEEEIELLNLLEQEDLTSRQTKLIPFIKEYFPAFEIAWFHREMCKALEWFSAEVIAKRAPRLIINGPPRHGKTITVGESFPIWHLGQAPEHMIITATYNATLAEKISKKARDLARMDFVKTTFPDLKLDVEKQSVQEWLTTYGGGYKAVGLKGSITGSGAHILNIDDPIKDHEEAKSKLVKDENWEWFTGTAMHRLMPGAGILLTMTRWADDDLCGRIIDYETKNGTIDRWKILRYKAIATEDEPNRKAGVALHPERFNIGFLNEIKGFMGTEMFDCLYQQDPTPDSGIYFRRDWFKYWTKTSLPGMFDEIIQSWDLSFGCTGDPVVCQIWGRVGSRRYLLDRLRRFMGFTETLKAIVEVSKKWPTATLKLIEKKANAEAANDAIKHDISGIVLFEPVGSKENRVDSILPLWEAENIYVPDPEMESFTIPSSTSETNFRWVFDYRKELLMFPKARHDDDVDATTQALIRMKRASFENISSLGSIEKFGVTKSHWKGF